MKFVRLLLIWLGVLVALAAVLVAVSFTSPVQTWFAQSFLDRQPGWKSSLGEASAGFGEVKLTDLQLEANGAILTLPSLQVRMPLAKAVREHSAIVQGLVARGWTLDLSGLRDSPAEATPAVSAPAGSPPAGMPALTQAQAADTAVKKVEEVFRGILGGWSSPYDFAVDGVELEGDVLVSVSPDRAPVRVHVTLTGGGLSSGHEGIFALESTVADPWPDVSEIVVHGHLTAGMSSPRTLDRVEIKADIVPLGRMIPEGFPFAIDLATRHRGGETSVAFNLHRDQSREPAIHLQASAKEHRIAGNWNVNVQGTDWPPFIPRVRLPAVQIEGVGSFDSDDAFAQVHVHGGLLAKARDWDVLAPALKNVGAMAINTRFDLTRRGHTIRVDSLETSVTGIGPIAELLALQPFDFETETGNVQLTAPAGDWLDATVQGLPLNWLSGFTGAFAVTGGGAVGKFILRVEKDGFALRSPTPLLAHGVAVERAGRPLARDLDLSLDVSAHAGPDGWTAKGEPLVISSGGHSLAVVKFAAVRAGSGQPVTLNGTWSADIDAMAAQPALAAFSGMRARSASGDFNATLDNGAEVDAKLTVLGHDPTHSLTATVHAETAGEGTLQFNIPITLSLGKSVSVFSAEGSWSGRDTGVRLNGRLTGEAVDLDYLRLLVTPAAAALGFPRSLASTPENPASAVVRDQKPFWTGWSGEVTVAFDHLRSGSRDFPHVGATFDFDETSIAVNRAWFGSSAENPMQMEASLSFDGAAEFPYRLKATLTVNDIDIAPLLGASPKKDEHHQDYKYGDDHAAEPVLEGHFSLTAALTGNGRSPGELRRRVQEEYHVTGKGGIIRLLKTSVGDALPDEPPTPVGDAASTVGGWVSWLAGVKKDSLGSDEKKVARNTDAVINLTSQVAEIGYDQISVTAIRGRDDAIRLVAIDLTARDERLTGSGQIAAGSGQPLAARPLSMELKLGVRGNVAALLSEAGLLSKQNDDLGYLQLMRPAPLHFGGTLQQPDATDWHDLLAKAAMPPVQAKPAKK